MKILLNSRHIYQPTVHCGFFFSLFHYSWWEEEHKMHLGLLHSIKNIINSLLLHSGGSQAVRTQQNDIAGDQPKTNLCVRHSWWQMGLGAVQFVWVTLVMMDDHSRSVCDVSTMTSGTSRVTIDDHGMTMLSNMVLSYKSTDVKQRDSTEFPLDIIGCTLNIQTGYKSFWQVYTYFTATIKDGRSAASEPVIQTWGCCFDAR